MRHGEQISWKKEVKIRQNAISECILALTRYNFFDGLTNNNGELYVPYRQVLQVLEDEAYDLQLDEPEK